MLVDVEHVATLGVEGGIATEVQRDILVIGVILEDVLAVQGLAVTGDRVHTVQVHAGAHHGERVAREVEVGHRVDDEVGLALGVHQGVEGHRARVRHLDLGLGDTGHGLLDVLEIVGDGIEELAHSLRGHLALDSGLLEPLLLELSARLGYRVEGLSDELLEIQHLDALLA